MREGWLEAGFALDGRRISQSPGTKASTIWAAHIWHMAAMIHTKARRQRFMSLLCLLCVPWQGLAPLLTPQTRVTQPLSSAYSHPAYPLGVWGGGGAGPIPDRLEPLSHRELLFFFGGDTVSVPSGSCLRALLGASVSAHLNPMCARVCVCVCTHACIHMHTPMSSPSICCQWSYCYCTPYS